MELAIRHRRMIESYAYAIVRDLDLAEDIYQEVALVLVAQWDRVPADEGFLPWLKEVIRRKSHEVRRRQTRRTRELSPEALDRIEAALPDEDSEGVAAAVALCVDRLAGDARLAIRARYGEGLDVAAIAARIGRSVQGAYAVLKRARLALEDCLHRRLHLETGA